MSWAQTISSLLPLPRPDDRSNAEIERDLEDEINFHLDQSARRLMADGATPPDARGFARRRFGDIERIKQQCKRIALEERVMLHRINFIMMAVVLLMVVGVGVQVMVSQSRTASALQAITTEIANMKYATGPDGAREGATGAGGDGAGSSSARPDGRVLVAGDTAKAGWYALTLDKVTYVSDILTEVGVGADQWVQYRSGGSSSSKPAEVYLTGQQRKTVLRPNDELHIYDDVPPQTRRSWFLSADLQEAKGTFPQVDDSGSPIENGWRLECTSDGQSQPGYRSGYLRRAEGEDLFVALLPSGAQIQAASGEREHERLMADWDLRDGKLILDLSRAEPLRIGGQPIGTQIEPLPLAKEGQLMFSLRAAKPGSAEAERGGPAAADTRTNRADDDDFPELSPFHEVRWHQWTPFVNIDGTWGELVSINDIPITDIIEFCQREFQDNERKRFTEDLVQVLTKMGHRPTATAKIQLKEARTGTVMSIGQAPLTEDNRRSLWEMNHRAANTEPGHPVWIPDLPPDQQPPLPEAADENAPAPGSTALTPAQLEADIQALGDALRERFSYLHLRGVDLEQALDALRTEVSAGGSGGAHVDAFAQAVQRMICRFGDGHAGVSGLEVYLPPPFAPFLVGDAGGTLIAFQPDRSGFVDADHPMLISVNGIDADQLLGLAGEFVADGSPALRRSRSIRNLRWLGHLCAKAGIEAGTEVEVELASLDGSARRTLKFPVSLAKPVYGAWPRTESRVLDNDVGYLRLAEMDSDAAKMVKWMMPQFRHTRGLVIDVRGNGGGSREALLALLPYFLPPDSPPQVINIAAYRLSPDFPADHLASRFLYRRDDARWTEAEQSAIDHAAAAFQLKWSPPRDQFSDWHYLVISRPAIVAADSDLYVYERPAVVLLDGGCFSATDIFLSAFKGRPNITLLGEPSGGGSGRKRSTLLPNSGLLISLSSMISYRPDGTMYDATGIEPDVVQPPIATDFIVNGTDSQLDAAVELLSGP